MFAKRKTFHLHQANAKGSQTSVFKGLSLALLAGVLGSVYSAMVKEVANLHPGQLVFYRYTEMLFLSLPETVKSGQNPFGPREYRWLLVLRGIFGTTAAFLMFSAYQLLSLSVACSIIYCAPIFVTVFARVFLKEPMGVFQSLSVLVTVTGIILVTKLPSQLTEHPIVYSTETIYGFLAAITAAVALGFETITVRKIKSVHESVVMFNCCWFAILESLVLTAVLGKFRWQHCGIQSLFIVLIGWFSYFAIHLVVIALQSELAGPVYTIRAASEVVLSFLWQTIIFRDYPDTFGIIGAALILLSVASINLSKWLSNLPNDSNLRRKFKFII